MERIVISESERDAIVALFDILSRVLKLRFPSIAQVLFRELCKTDTEHHPTNCGSSMDLIRRHSGVLFRLVQACLTSCGISTSESSHVASDNPVGTSLVPTSVSTSPPAEHICIHLLTDKASKCELSIVMFLSSRTSLLTIVNFCATFISSCLIMFFVMSWIKNIDSLLGALYVLI